MKRIRKRLTYANVMSSVAVFLVVAGGSAFAVTQLPNNSVGSPQIKKNAVRTGDIARNAVRAGKLAPEAAKAGKIAKNAITTNRLRNDAVTGAKVNEASLGTVPSATSASNADLLDGLDSSAFVGKQQLQASSAIADSSEDRVLVAFPELGFELRTTGPDSVGYAATAPGEYLWSGYYNGVIIFNALGPSGEFVVANVAFNAAEGPNLFSMVRRDSDGSNLGVATAECFRNTNTTKEIACLSRYASSG